MLDTATILRLLLDDEPPGPPPPDDPNQLSLGFDPDAFDPDAALSPSAEITRYANEMPFSIPGGTPTRLYQRLETKLNGRPSKKVDNHTYIVRGHDRIAVRFYQTDVVAAYPDGKVVLNSGGWRPGGGQYSPGWRGEPGKTTMARMNEWMPSGWGLYRLKGEWYWYNHNQPPHWEAEHRYPYSDGDSILPSGSLQAQAEAVPIPRRRKKAV